MITEEGTPQQFKETLMNAPLEKCIVCGYSYMRPENIFEHPAICPRCKPHTYTTRNKEGELCCVSIDLSNLPADMGDMTLGQIKARVMTQIRDDPKSLPDGMTLGQAQQRLFEETRVDDWIQLWPTNPE